MVFPTYQVLPIVTPIHSVPHMNYKLELQGNSFGVYYDSYLNDYSKSLIPMPTIIFFCGLFALFLFNFIILTRYYCGACKCAPGDRYKTDGRKDSFVWVSSSLFSMSTLSVVFWVWFLCKLSLLVTSIFLKV